MTREDLQQLNTIILATKYFHSNHRCSQLEICLSKFHDAYYIFAGANINLGNAANEDISIDGWECDDSQDKEIIKLFIRSEYLKSAMQSYRAIEDYMMQIIVFGYNLKGEIISKSDYKKKRKNLYYNKVIELLDSNIINNEIKNILTEFHFNIDFDDLIGKVNSLKHDYNLRFDNGENSYPFSSIPITKLEPFPQDIQNKIKSIIEERRIGVFTTKLPNTDIQRKVIFTSKWITPKSFSLNDYIDKCYRLNIVIKSYVENIYTCIVNEYPEYKLEQLL